MKTVFKFKPFKHWNYITDCQYDILVKFYGEDMLKTEQEMSPQGECLKEEENETN